MPTFIRSIEEMHSCPPGFWENKTIELKSDKNSLLWRTEETRYPVHIIGQKHFTIDGGEQGITIYGTSLFLDRCEDVTLRNLTILLGAKGILNKQERIDLSDAFKGYNGEALKIDKCKNILVENCTFAWGLDETLSIEDSKDVKVKECMIAYPLQNPKSFDELNDLTENDNPDHAYPVSTRGCKRVLYRRCIFAHGVKRFPQFAASGKYDTIGELSESICYNFSQKGTRFNGNESGDYELKIHDNYYIERPGVSDGKFIAIDGPKNHGKITVKYWRNVSVKAVKIKPVYDRNMNRPPEPLPNKDVKPKAQKQENRVILKNNGNGYPTMPYFEIINRVGPVNATKFTEKVKSELRSGLLPDLQHPHEPEDFNDD